jgi:hypothetical protein
MYQLEHIQAYIDNSVIMLNVDLTLGNSSVIQFGGYDSTALKAGSGGLKIFNVTHGDQWMLTASGFAFGNDEDTKDEARHVVFSPDKPFLYLPPTDVAIW